MTNTTATLKITRVSHQSCDSCGDYSIRFREDDTIYVCGRCAAPYIEDPDLWAEFVDAPHAITVTVNL